MSLKLSQMGLSLFSSTRPQPVQRVLNRDPCSSTTCSEPTTKTIFITCATRQMIMFPYPTDLHVCEVRRYSELSPQPSCAHITTTKMACFNRITGYLFEPGPGFMYSVNLKACPHSRYMAVTAQYFSLIGTTVLQLSFLTY